MLDWSDNLSVNFIILEEYPVLDQGLKEGVQVHSKRDVDQILEKCSAIVFTGTFHMQLNNMKGEEVLLIGMLVWVDFAGSDNVGMATGKRATEAGNIKQSPITFGQ